MSFFAAAMPGTKRVMAYPPNGKKKTYKRRRVGPVPTRAIMSLRPQIRKVYPEAQRHRTTLRYFGNFISVNPGIGGIAAGHVFSANGCYDPDITGGGHQPIGFDQLMALYDHYTVVGAKIRCHFQNKDTSYPQFCAIAVRDSPTLSTDTREIVENGYVTMGHLAVFGTGGDKASLATSVDVAKFLGRTNVLSDSQLKGSSAANPGEQLYFHLYGFPTEGVDSNIITINCVIDYDVVFHEKTVTLPS